MTLTKDDLQAISDLVDERLEIKLDEKFKKELKPIKDDIGDLKSDVKILRSDVQDLKVRVGILEADVCGLKSDMQDLKSDVKVLKGDVQGLKGDVEVLKGDVQGLKGDVKVLKGDVQGLKGSVDILQVKVDRNTRMLKDVDINLRNVKYIGIKKFARLQDGVVFQIKRAANLQIILAPYKIDVVLQPHYPETLLHITRTKILPCKLIAQEYSVSSYENGSSSSSIWQA